jgi:hypothetical protein
MDLFGIDKLLEFLLQVVSWIVFSRAADHYPFSAILHFFENYQRCSQLRVYHRRSTYRRCHELRISARMLEISRNDAYGIIRGLEKMIHEKT